MTRPITTLKSSKEFNLTREDRKVGFFNIYHGRWGTPVTELLTTIIGNILFPWTRNEDGDFEAKSIKNFSSKCLQDSERRQVVKSILRKDNPTKSIEFKAPLFWIDAFNAEGYLSGLDIYSSSYLKKMDYYTQRGITEQVKTIADTPFANGRVLTGREIVGMLRVTTRVKEMLLKSLKSMEAAVENGKFVIWATWRISQKEAEYFNNSSFLEIKLSNFYPTLMDWAANIMGRNINLPVGISSIAKISKQVGEALAKNPNVQPRVGIDGMITDIHKNIYILPDIDQSAAYEQQLMDFGLRPDGSYSWAQPEGLAGAEEHEDDGFEVQVDEQYQQVRRKLPINMPIFTDWLNAKFSYSNSAGNLSVYDLSQSVPVKAFHITEILNTLINEGYREDKQSMTAIIATAVNLAASFDQSILKERPTALEAGSPETFKAVDTWNIARFLDAVNYAYILNEILDPDGDSLYPDGAFNSARLHQFHPKSGLPAFAFLGRMIEKAQKVLLANQEVMFRRYSVLNVLNMTAITTLFVKHAPNYAAIAQTDRTDREAYLKQEEVDPNYKAEAVPQIKKGLNYMPHQNKAHRKTARGPKFVIYGVDAGGGKTIIIMTNILLEMKKGTCRRPVVACPAHLVSQYVKECVYVTEGRLNIIPVTNTTMKSHGEEKLFQMITNAPLNTLVVTDFNFLKGKGQDVAYGNRSIPLFRNAEFMRQFEFDLIAIDESHYLKNSKSNRREAVSRFIFDIPQKRLASGTFVSDTMKDVVSQYALFDPTVFGSEEHFKNEFGDTVKGGKVLSWKPGAERDIRMRMNEHAVYVQAKRKEWAALLPDATERFLGVELTPNQRILYASILDETTKMIEEAAAKNPELKELMESEDDSRADELEALLRPYMARLERFLSAPMTDPAAALFLKDEADQVSPKVAKVYQICKEHLDKQLPGKILIFTQYTASAEAVAQFAPPELKKLIVHYTADSKIEAKAAFENDDKKKIMVGVSQSMDTGLNLQHVSRLIRMETVWTPGVLEQGNSRVNRPELKKTELRKQIYFDWLVVNRTVDITKVSRLIAKLISKTKFDEYDNPMYDAVPDMPQVPITLESISTNNDFKEELLDYLEAYQTLDSVKKEDYRLYREQHPELVPVEVPQGGLLPNSKLMSRVPYVPEMDIYGTAQLGLIRYDEFVRQDMEALDEDEGGEDEANEDDEGGEDGGDSTDPKVLKQQQVREAIRKEREHLRDRGAHTAYGDGVIIGLGKRRVRIRLADGSVVRPLKMETYIITRSETNGIDMRNELLKQVGQIPIDKPITVPAADSPQDKKRKGKSKQETVEPTEVGLSAEFDFTIINDYLGLMYRGGASDNPEVSSALQNMGFRISPEYVFSKVPGPVVLIGLFRAWKAKGFTIDKKANALFKMIYTTIKSNKTLLRSFGFATQMSLRNFYREEIRPSADQKELKVYPLIQDGNFFVMLPTKGQAANKAATRVQPTGIRWKHGGGHDEMIRFVVSKVEAKKVLQEIVESGITIDNIKELNTQFTSLKFKQRN